MKPRFASVSFASVLVASVSFAASLCAQEDQPKTIPRGYRVETIATPKGVPFGVGGLSFARDGTLFVSTREGDVWKWREGEWRQFAKGLHEPLGIFVDPDNDRVFVIQRPEMTELIDTDGDGVADYYKTVNASWGLTDNYHEYAFGLVRDAEGYFYGTLNTSLSWKGWAGSYKWDIARVHDSKMGRAAKYRGWSFRISPRGEFEPWSCGLRSPAGIGISPAGDLFYTENQGDFVATSALHHIVKGRFHGHASSLMDHPDFQGIDLNSVSLQAYDQLRKAPAVNFPHGDLASSPGEPVWDETEGRFGPFAGQCFVGDQTRSNVFRVVLDKVGGEYQGCAIDFADHLQSGIVRSRFAPDGSLFVGQTGRGWGSRGKALYGLQRLVWDGKTVPFAIHSVRLAEDNKGFVVKFTTPAAAARLAKASSYRVETWRYRYQAIYGSKKFDKHAVTVRAVPAEDGRSVRLELPLRVGWMYALRFELTARGGQEMANRTAWYTLNSLH